MVQVPCEDPEDAERDARRMIGISGSVSWRGAYSPGNARDFLLFSAFWDGSRDALKRASLLNSAGEPAVLSNGQDDSIWRSWKLASSSVALGSLTGLGG